MYVGTDLMCCPPLPSALPHIVGARIAGMVSQVSSIRALNSISQALLHGSCGGCPQQQRVGEVRRSGSCPPRPPWELHQWFLHNIYTI